MTTGTGRDQAPARRGTNLLRVADYNEIVVLDAIRRAEPRLSRVELATATGLSGQTVSNIIRRLLDAGLVREAGRQKPAGLGKPRTLLELEPSGQYAVGVHLDPAVVTVVVLDLTGRVVARRREPPPAVPAPDALMETISRTVAELIAEAVADPARVVGLGVAAPGPIDADRGVVLDPPNLTGWHLVPLRDELARRTGLPVLLDKDVTAAASAEKWAGGPTGRGHFVFFYLGTGVGAGLVLADEVVRGASGNVGEIGHITVDPEGPMCPCGRRGCVGVASEPRYLVALAADAGLVDPVDPDDRHAVDTAFAALCDRADAGDPRAAGILSAMAGRVTKAVEDIANLLDLDRVVFGGPHWTRLAPYFHEQLRTDLEQRFVVRAVHPFAVTGTALGADVGAVGAAALVLDNTFSPNPSVLLLRS